MISNGKIKHVMELIHYESECKSNVLAVYPEAICMKKLYKNGCKHFYIRSHDGDGDVGFSKKSQKLAWENAWYVISKKMKRKLER